MSNSVEKVPEESAAGSAIAGSNARFGLPSLATVLLSQLAVGVAALSSADESHSPGVWSKVGGGFVSPRIEIPTAVQSWLPKLQLLETEAAPALVEPLLEVAPAL